MRSSGKFSSKAMKPIYFVGAGPGDAELITVKGKNLLQQADVVIYTNSLIPDQILAYCRSSVELIPSLDLSLETMIEMMITHATNDRLVIRLHDGDPSLFSTIGEQINLLNQAGIPIEVIPGVSAFQLAAARLKTELTVPELVQTIILTRASGRTKVPEKEALMELAKHRASLCLYLSAKHIHQAQLELLEHYPQDTPVAICYHLGWEDEIIKLTTLDCLATVSCAMNLSRSVLYIISPALKQEQNRSQLYQQLQ